MVPGLGEHSAKWDCFTLTSATNWPLKRSPHLTAAQQTLPVLSEKMPQSCNPFPTGNEWEYVETILDSEAAVSVIPPDVGRAYEVVPSAASKAGV